jgi:hypothetical protein
MGYDTDPLLRSKEVLMKIGELKNLNCSWTEISERMKKEHNVEVSPQVAQSLYKTYATRMAEVIAGDTKIKDELRGVVLDKAEQLKSVNEMVWSVIKDSKTTNKDKLLAAREVLAQLELHEKLFENLKKDFDFRQISRIEYTKVSVDNLDYLEKEGYIKILKKPGVSELVNVTPEAPDIGKEEEKGLDENEELEKEIQDEEV